MSVLTSHYSALATGRSPVLDDRSYPEITRGDQYPEVNMGREDLESAGDTPKVYDSNSSPVREKGPPDQNGSRTGEYRILGLRPWVFVALVGVFAIAVAVAVGLAIGIPASRRNHGNSDSAARSPSGDTSSSSVVEPASPVSSPNPLPIIIKCPANDTNIITTFTNGTAQTPDQIQSHPLKYTIHCNKDYTGGGAVQDMFSVSVDSLAECINRCSMFSLQLPIEDQTFISLCSGVTLVQNRCYLKRGLTEDATSNLQHGVGDSAILVWET